MRNAQYSKSKYGNSNSARYAVTERKKAELDSLALQVLDAQQQVDQFQAIVTALTGKLNNFQAILVVDDATRASALNNKTLVDQLVQSFLDLQNNSSIAFNEMAEADVLTNTLAANVNVVVEKLIYTADYINKLAANVTRKKAMNPLISDDLVSMLVTAGADANNAVALSLVALQTAFTAQSTNTESQAATSLEYVQSMDVYQLITGTDVNGNKVLYDNKEIQSLRHLLHEAYSNAKLAYRDTQLAINLITEELNVAQINLDAAQVSLQSLQSGLAAGTAAALAS
jgi:hypothetical protein